MSHSSVIHWVSIYNSANTGVLTMPMYIQEPLSHYLTQYSFPCIFPTPHSARSSTGFPGCIIFQNSLLGALNFTNTHYLKVGNQAFANYVDAHVTSLTHVNNKQDPVPILPGLLLGYHHPSGEVHIDKSNAWMSCPGMHGIL